jgi:hypothetical protein
MLQGWALNLSGGLDVEMLYWKLRNHDPEQRTALDPGFGQSHIWSPQNSKLCFVT